MLYLASSSLISSKFNALFKKLDLVLLRSIFSILEFLLCLQKGKLKLDFAGNHLHATIAHTPETEDSQWVRSDWWPRAFMLAKGCSCLDPVSRDDELSLPGVRASDLSDRGKWPHGYVACPWFRNDWAIARLLELCGPSLYAVRGREDSRNDFGTVAWCEPGLVACGGACRCRRSMRQVFTEGLCKWALTTIY